MVVCVHEAKRGIADFSVELDLVMVYSFCLCS